MTDSNANPGSGDPENSEDGKSKEEMIPASQMKAALKHQGETHTAEMQELRTGFEQRISNLEKPAAPTEKEPETFTRAELRQLVKDEHITQEQADLKWDTQQEAKFNKNAETVSRGVVEESQLLTKVEQDIDRYVALEPEINTEGSETRKKIKKEFTFLVKHGDSATSMTTELKAIRAVLGPIESFELARSGKSGHESYDETGGDGGGESGKGKKFQDSLTERKRGYYQKMIDQGFYKSWDDVKAELNPKAKAA